MSRSLTMFNTELSVRDSASGLYLEHDVLGTLEAE